MENDAGQGRIRDTLDDLKRRLQKERQESETLTHHLAFQRERAPAEDSRLKKLETELVVQTQLVEELRQQLAAEQQSAQARRSEPEAKTRQLEEALAAVQRRLGEQKEAAEQLIQQLAAERDESRARLREVESGTGALEEELAEARRQLNEYQQTAETIRQLTAERDENRAQLNEVESRIQVLTEDLMGAQEQFREQREMAVNVMQRLESERDELRARLNEEEARTQKLEDELAASRQQLQEQRNAVAASERARAEQQALLHATGGRQDSAPDGSLNGRLDLWRMAVSLTLVLMSSDLLATNLRSSPETRDAAREIQLGSQKLLDFLRTFDFNAPAPDSAKPNPSPETPREPAGPLGTVTPA